MVFRILDPDYCLRFLFEIVVVIIAIFLGSLYAFALFQIIRFCILTLRCCKNASRTSIHNNITV